MKLCNWITLLHFYGEKDRWGWELQQSNHDDANRKRPDPRQYKTRAAAIAAAARYYAKTSYLCGGKEPDLTGEFAERDLGVTTDVRQDINFHSRESGSGHRVVRKSEPMGG